MPTYEYKCEECGQTFEVRQKFADQPLTVHENCGGKVERLLSAPALQFKGTGWYVTDYGRKNGHSSASNGSKDKHSSTEKSETKTETKAETKTESKTDTKAAATPK